VFVLIAIATVATVAPATARSSVIPTAARLGQPPLLPVGSNDAGPIDPSTTLRLDVALEPRDPASLAAFVSAVTSPGSSQYHRYLGRGQFADRFGPTASSEHAAAEALRDLGLRVLTFSSDGLTITASAPAAVIEQAFDIGIDQIALPDGAMAYANLEAPLVPGPLGSFVAAIGGLSNISQAVPASIDSLAAPSAAPASDDGAAPGTRSASTSGPTDCSAVHSAISN
jgi:subtilase family serine protease